MNSSLDNAEARAEIQSPCLPPNESPALLPMREGSTPFWWQALDDLEARPANTGVPMDIWARASCWVTCACGKQDPRIPRGSIGAPIDEGLRKLGEAFPIAVGARDVPLARNILIQIEKRAAELLAGAA